MRKDTYITLSRDIEENREEKYNNASKRIEEVENWLMDNPYTHDDFEKHVEERNNLLITINNYETTKNINSK